MSLESRKKFTQAVIGEFFAFTFAIILMFAFSLIVLIPLLISGDYYEGKYLISEGFETLLLLLFTQLSFLSVFFWRWSDYKENIKEWKSSGKSFSVYILIAIGIIVGLLLCAFNYLHDFILINISNKEIPLNYPWLEFQKFPYHERVMLFIIGITIVPIIEELFFREMMFGNILRNGFTKTAYIFSIIAFAIVHFDLTGILVYATGGFALAFLYQKTHSIIAPIFAHTTVNVLALSFLLQQ